MLGERLKKIFKLSNFHNVSGHLMHTTRSHILTPVIQHKSTDRSYVKKQNTTKNMKQQTEVGNIEDIFHEHANIF